MAQTRTTDTKRKIKAAFTQIVQEKGMDALTVSDVARRAGINRGTVYLHYADKYDMLHQLEDEALEKLAAYLFPDEEAPVRNLDELVPYEAVKQALDYVKSDIAFFQALVGEGGDPQFSEQFKQLVGMMIHREVSRSSSLALNMQGVPEDYAHEIALGSVMAVCLLWIRKGASEPTELIARLITRAKTLSPYDFLE